MFVVTLLSWGPYSHNNSTYPLIVVVCAQTTWLSFHAPRTNQWCRTKRSPQDTCTIVTPDWPSKILGFHVLISEEKLLLLASQRIIRPLAVTPVFSVRPVETYQTYIGAIRLYFIIIDSQSEEGWLSAKHVIASVSITSTLHLILC